MLTVHSFIRSTSVLQRAIWLSAKRLQFPVAVWRLPRNDTVHILVDLSGHPLRTAIDFEELPAGFAFCPFGNLSGEKGLFLNAHLHFVFRQDLPPAEDHSVPAELHSQYLKFQSMVDRLSSESVRQPELVRTLEVSAYPEDPGAENHFRTAVDRAVAAIREGRFQKVVLSRQKKVPLPKDFDQMQTYLRLCRHYPLAFVSLVSVPGHGTWMGASPEILVSVDRLRIFRTMALAGTQPYLPDVAPSQVAWTQKEIEEQALVSRYIINCFKQIRLREFEEDGPKTVVAGNLMHLRTDFQVDTQATGFPQLGTVMLGLLHPTSAVCGMPKEAALHFIRENEGYDRAFYSGYLGPVNLEGESHLYVNLRCSQWLENGALLYAGAGITANSVAEKEWRETELKCQTMYQVLGATQ